MTQLDFKQGDLVRSAFDTYDPTPGIIISKANGPTNLIYVKWLSGYRADNHEYSYYSHELKHFLEGKNNE